MGRPIDPGPSFISDPVYSAKCCSNQKRGIIEEQGEVNGTRLAAVATNSTSQLVRGQSSH